MALSVHVATRIYGQVFGNPPFENASGQAALSNVKPFPAPPLTYVPTNQMTIWPLANGYLIGNTYVYSILELQPAGLNQPSVKFATDTLAATLASNAT